MIVVDASAVVDALVGDRKSDDLRNFLAGQDLQTPTLLDYEVVSALRGLTLGGHISPVLAEDALADLNDLPMRRWLIGDGLRRRAFQLRDNLSSYDAAYVALAESLECPLITCDARIARAAGHVVHIEVF